MTFDNLVAGQRIWIKSGDIRAEGTVGDVDDKYIYVWAVIDGRRYVSLQFCKDGTQPPSPFYYPAESWELIQE